MAHLSESIRPCPICGENKKELLFHQQFSELSTGALLAGYNVVVCRNCGFCFADNIPDQKAFDIYYKEMSKYEHLERSGQPSEFETRQFPALAQFIQKYVPDQRSRILEVGCANGGLLNALKELGYNNILGVDPSPACADNAAQLYQIRVITSALSDLRTEIGQFDFIILVAVLEHINDLESSIRKLRELLSPTSKLYIEVPDATQFTSSPDAPFQEFSVEHINYFSSISLANLMKSRGFSEVSSTQVSYNQTEDHTGHALRMVFQQDPETEKSGLIRDEISAPSLKNYVAVSKKVENRIHDVVNELVDSQLPLIIWGVGTHTQRLLATSRLGKANIIAFVDSNPKYQENQLNNVPILDPRQLAGTGAAILVSSRIYQSEIVTQIQSELGLKNELITLYED
jgi:SAM-dependent methyltransferase